MKLKDLLYPKYILDFSKCISLLTVDILISNTIRIPCVQYYKIDLINTGWCVIEK